MGFFVVKREFLYFLETFRKLARYSGLGMGKILLIVLSPTTLLGVGPNLQKLARSQNTRFCHNLIKSFEI